MADEYQYEGEGFKPYEQDEPTNTDFDTTVNQDELSSNNDDIVQLSEDYNGVTLDDTYGIQVVSLNNTLTMNATAGLEIIRNSDSAVMFSVDSTTGDVIFSGTLNGAGGTFSGTIDSDSLLITPKSGQYGMISFDQSTQRYVLRQYLSSDGTMEIDALDKQNNMTQVNLIAYVLRATNIDFSNGDVSVKGLSTGAHGINLDGYTIDTVGMINVIGSGGTIQLNSTVNGTTSYLDWFDGSNRLGYLGKSTATNQNLTMKAELADLVLASTTNRVLIQAAGSGTTGYIQMGTHVQPDTDNTYFLGLAANRWKTIYAGTSTINTSDEREKQQISDVPDEWLDAWATVDFLRYKFNDAVQAKGEGDARWHIGVIAQRIQTAFENSGLDPFEVGLLCYDEWVDSNGQPQNVYSVRFDECQFLEMALMRREVNKLKGVS